MGKFYPWVWFTWGTWFMVWEFLAIGTGNDQDTLSEYVWRLEEINQSWTALRWFIATLCLWLFFHMAFGWFR